MKLNQFLKSAFRNIAVLAPVIILADPPFARSEVLPIATTEPSRPPAAECNLNQPGAEPIQACTKIIDFPDTSSDDRAAAYTVRGLVYARANQLSLALDDLKKADAIKPSPALDTMIGMIDINTSNSNEAITYFSKVVDAGAATAEVFNLRGAAYQNNAQYEESIKDFNMALQLNPKMIGAINNRGAAYAKQGNLDAALMDFKAVLAASPNDPLVLTNVCGIELSKGNVEEGAHLCDQADKAAKESYFVQGALGGTYYEVGQYKKALEHFSNAITLNPRDARSLYMRGIVNAKLGNSDAASMDKNAAALIDSGIADFMTRNGVKE